MGLKIWLPLDGNLENKGIDQEIIFNSTPTWDNNAKIGQKCLRSTLGTFTVPSMANKKEMSFAYWVKINTSTTTNWLDTITWYTTDGETAQTCRQEFYNTTGTSMTTGCWYKGGSNSGFINQEIGKWYHYIFTINYNTGESNFYINGVFQKKTTNIDTSHYIRETNNFRLRQSSLDSSINDFRLYDHILSPLEIKQISQGLVLHYKFDNVLNLIQNGCGEDGSKNWGTVKNISQEIPEGISYIKKSFYSNTSMEYIPIITSHRYRLEVYVKNTATSGSTYPSFYPYDIDKKFIYNYQCKDGFNLSTMTVLTKELKAGDTQIEVADLSKWNANSGHYYNYAAIFGYRDSTGFIYSDGEYTQNTPIFGTGTNAKTNLDKENNIITLNSAYSGNAVPIGTAICAATAGGSYFYPFGAISKSTINEWTFKTVDFTPERNGRLKYAKYIKYSTYDATLHAGIRLIDLYQDTNNRVQDSSGYNHNGTIFGTLLSNHNTAKYSNCIYIPIGNSNYIVTNQEIGNFSEGITMSIWFRSTCTTPGGSFHQLFNIATATQQYEFAVHNTGYFRGGMMINGTRYVANTNNTNLLNGNWHMLTMTYDGTSLKRYVDGILKSTSNIEGTLSATSCKFMFGHYGTNLTYYMKEGFLSDARIYVTPLSQEDINKLYQTNLSIDNLDKIHTFELKESNSRELLHGRRFTAGYSNHNSLVSAQPNFSNGELFLNGNGKSVGSDYIWINPIGKTYYYDIDVSINAGNQFYIGFERYDIKKTTRSNNACVYVIAIKPTSDLVHKRYRGVISLATDGVNPCAFIALRILSGWSGTTSGVTGVATVHRLSLREVTTLQQPKLYEEGILLGDEFNEHQKASFYNNGIIEAVNYIEK